MMKTTPVFSEDIGHGAMTAEFDVFYDHCDGCTKCASKATLCADGVKLLEHAVKVASQDVPKVSGAS